MDGPSEAVFGRMTDEQLRALVEHLTVYALMKMRRLTWRGVRYARSDCAMTVARGNEPQDLVSDVILRVIEGKRKWDSKKEPDLRVFLRSAIDSRVNQLADSADNRHTNEQVVVAAKADAISLESSLPSREEATPLDLLIDKEAEESFRTVASKAVEGDPMLSDLLECLREGLTPAETAEYLDVDIGEIYSARKRLYRALSKALGKLARSLP
ncbi:MAG: sigma-70 family RNA polymerase sigma factor [Planctomycetes bacterium]|nr:sigma-70 family RNA polymerase sigma factor [Planctomycetota bacterium]